MTGQDQNNGPTERDGRGLTRSQLNDLSFAWMKIADNGITAMDGPQRRIHLWNTIGSAMEAALSAERAVPRDQGAGTDPSSRFSKEPPHDTVAVPREITAAIACALEDCGPPERQTTGALAELIKLYAPMWANALLAAAPPPTGEKGT